MPRPIRAAISASAFAQNLSVARRHAGAAKIWAVIKANAYGHGLERAASALAAADGFAVLDFQEAARLRLAGVTKPILMLEGVFKPLDVPLLSQYALTPVIHNAEQVDMLRTGELHGPLDIYLKLNSGMNRLGFTPENLGASYRALRENPRIRSITLMTHFADADGPTGVKAQLEWFGEMTQSFPHKRSLANSAALLRFPEAHGEWVRPGIMLYGCSPFADRPAGTLDLRPAMTLTSEIIAMQHLQAGERVGYGFSYEAVGELEIGIVACGYADGYPRHAPVGTPVLVNGQRTRIVGRVSMDMITVDLSGMADAGVGSPVTLWGEGLSADEVAAAAGTLSYELLCALAPRVPVTEVP
ncbi:MAG TPA: alanine racemase [Burkholderiales bacterium]|nr:alanine racemase [Burkholderiales bacterium]